MSQRLTEEEIKERGIIRDVPSVLDDSEDREAAGHWHNTSGRRLYSSKRVELAEQLLKTRDSDHFVNDKASDINASQRPCTPAVFIFDYRTLVKALDPDLDRKIWRERLCHPFAGRVPGSNERENGFIKEALLLLTRHGFPDESIGSFADVERFLESLAATAHKQLDPAWPHIVVRQPVLRHSLFRGKSPKAARRVLSVLSLLQTRRLGQGLVSQAPLTLPELLSAAPALRIDHKVLNAQKVRS